MAIPAMMYVALALMAAGTAAQYQQQKAIKKKQRKFTAAESARQAEMDQQRDAKLRATLSELEMPVQEQRRNEIAAQLEEYMRPQDSSIGEYISTNAAAPTEIKEREARALAESMGKAKDFAKNLAAISSYGRLNMDTGKRLNRLGENVGRINTAQQRSSAILPFELQGAQSAGSGWGTFADIANGLGSIAGAYAATRTPTEPKQLGSGLRMGEVSSLAPGFNTGQGLKAGGGLGFKLPKMAF